MYSVEFSYKTRLIQPPENKKITIEIINLKNQLLNFGNDKGDERLNAASKRMYEELSKIPDDNPDSCWDAKPTEKTALPMDSEFETTVGSSGKIYRRDGDEERILREHARKECKEEKSKYHEEKQKILLSPDMVAINNMYSQKDYLLKQLMSSKVQNFLKKCPETYGEGYKQASYLSRQYYWEPFELVEHHAINIKMIKTDNGWMLAR
jgi:hypothetical protein